MKKAEWQIRCGLAASAARAWAGSMGSPPITAPMPDATAVRRFESIVILSLEVHV